VPEAEKGKIKFGAAQFFLFHYAVVFWLGLCAGSRTTLAAFFLVFVL
jgi:hypothetical protein